MPDAQFAGGRGVAGTSTRPRKVCSMSSRVQARRETALEAARWSDSPHAGVTASYQRSEWPEWDRRFAEYKPTVPMVVGNYGGRRLDHGDRTETANGAKDTVHGRSDVGGGGGSAGADVSS